MRRISWCLFSIGICLAAARPWPALAVTVKPVSAPMLRVDHALDHMRLDPKGRFLAYIGTNGLGLNVLDLKSKNIFRASEAQVGASFFWAPDGMRLIFREQSNTPSGAVRSTLKAYDCYLAKSVKLEEMPFSTGLLTFDPRDLRLQFLSPKGIRTKRIYFPDERLAKWQVAQRNEPGKFLATQRGVLWVTQGGYAMRKLPDDESGLESFDISPDGSTIAWATDSGRVYTSKDGKTPLFIGFGRDPKWHPERPELLYAGARMVGAKTIGYDLRITDQRGSGRFLTSTQFSDERWPQWQAKGKQILYTVAKTTDIYVLDFKQ